jgi:hypothetical protein
MERNAEGNIWENQKGVIIKVCCNGDSLPAGKSSGQVDYRVSDRQQDGKVSRF